MADKDLARVDFTIGGKLDQKSIDKAVKQGVDRVVSQTAKIPVQLQFAVSELPNFRNLSKKGGSGSGDAQKQQENIAKRAAETASALKDQASILERNNKVAKTLASRRERAEVKSLVAREEEAQALTEAAERAKRAVPSLSNQKVQLKPSGATPDFGGKISENAKNVANQLAANAEAQEKQAAESETALRVAKLVAKKKQGLDDRLAAARQLEIEAAEKAAQKSKNAPSLSNQRTQLRPTGAVPNLLNKVSDNEQKAAADAARSALEGAKFAQGSTAALAAIKTIREEIAAEESEILKATKAARSALKAAVKNKEALAKKAEDAEKDNLESILEEAAARGDSRANARADLEKQIELVDRAILDRKKKREQAENKARNAGVRLEGSIIKGEQAAADQKILDAQKQLLGSQIEQINEVRKAAALQRLANKQLEKQGQGKLAKPLVTQDSSTLSLSDGIKAAKEGISTLASSFTASAKDAVKFASEVRAATSQQGKLKQILADQNARLERTRSLIPKIQVLYSDTVTELQKQRRVVVETARKLQDTNKVIDSTKSDIREINVNLANAAVASASYNKALRDKFGVSSLKQAGDLADSLFEKSTLNEFGALSRLITKSRENQDKFNKLTADKIFLEKQQADLAAKAKKQGQEQVAAFTRGKELENKKVRLQEEATNLLNKLNTINVARVKTLAQLAAVEARGLINRAVNFATGRGGNAGGGNGGGGNGAPPGGPPPNRGNGGDDFKRGTSGVNAFNSTITKSYSLLERVRAGLNTTDRAALEFGQTVRKTTRSLLAFATPATAIFKLSSAIRTATDDVIKLDTQVRRLAFFESSEQGGIGKFANDIQDVGKKTTLLGNTFDNIANEARRTGVAIETVVAAAQTVSRIGEISFLPDGASSDFLKATLGLTQIEAGAISADRAAEILKATMSQFGLAAKDAIPIAAKFNAVALETSSSVEELATLTTRFGSAAINIQNLTLDQTLALASVTAKTLGTNTFRAATALRQLTTRIVQNAKEVKELTGVEVINDNGQLVGIESLLKNLEKLKELGDSSAGNVLARLLGEGENIADTFAIANAVGKIREEFSELENTATGTQKVKDQVAGFLAVIGLQSEGAESALNNLSTSFKQLVQSAGTVSLITGLANSFTVLIDGARGFSNAIGGITGAFSALGPALGTVFGGLIKKSLLATFGFFSGAAAKEAFRSNVEELLNTPVKRTKQIELLTKDGLLTVQQGSQFIERSNNLLVAQEKIEKQIRITKILINAEEKKSVTDLGKIKSLDDQILRLEQAKAAVLKNQQATTSKLVQTNLTGFALLKKELKENTGAALSAGLSTAAIAFGTFLPKIIGSGTNQQAMTDAIVSTFTGAALGAQIGGIFGPQGAVGGAIVGGLLANFNKVAEKISESDFVQAFAAAIETGRPGAKTANDSQKDIDENKKKLFVLEQQNKAVRAYLEAIERQHDRTIAGVVAQEKLQQALGRVKLINDEIASIEESIYEDRQNGIGVSEKLNRLKELAVKRGIEEKQSGKDIENSRARELKLQQQIASIQTGSEVASSVDKIKTDINSFLGQLKGKNTLRLEIEFDRRQIQDRIKALSNTRSVLLEAEASETNPEKREKIQQDLIKNSEQLIKETTAAYDNIFAGQRKVIEDQKNAAKEVLESYSQAAASLLNAQQTVFSQNKQVAASVLERAGLADRRSENRSAPSNETPFASAQREIKEAAESLKRTQNVRDPSLTSNRLFVKDLSGQFKEAGARLKELDGIYKLNQDSLTLEMQARKTLLEAAQNNFEQQISFERDNLESRKESAERLISKQQELIAAEVKMIEVIKERAKQEAEFGRNLIEAPEEAFQNLKNLDLAKQFFSIDKELNSRANFKKFDADKSGKLDTAEIEASRNSILSERLEKLLAQSGGRGVTQQILEGLRFGGGLAKDPFGEAGNSAALEELLARLIGGGNVPTKPGQVSELRGQENTVENRRKQLDDTFKSIDAIIGQQLELERKVQTVEKERLGLIQAQVDQLKNIKLPESLNAVDVAVLRFTKTVEAIVPLLDRFRELAELNPTGPEFENAISELRSVAESFSAAAGNDNLKTEDLVNSLGSTFDASIERLNGVLSNLQVQFSADVAPIEVKLKAAIVASLDGEALGNQLRETLIGTGLEDRVTEIQGIITRLVEIEKGRGGKFPPAPPK